MKRWWAGLLLGCGVVVANLFLSNFAGAAVLSDKPLLVSQDFPIGQYVSLCRDDGSDAAGVWQFRNSAGAQFLYNQKEPRCHPPVPDYLTFTEPAPAGAHVSLCVKDAKEELVWQVGESGRVAYFLYSQFNDQCPGVSIPASVVTVNSPPRILGFGASPRSLTGTTMVDFWLPINDTNVTLFGNEEQLKRLARGPVGSRRGPSMIDSLCSDSETCWDYLKRIAREKGINQAFVFTLWGEEGGFGLSAGCPSAPLVVRAQLDCMTDVVAKAAGSLEDFFAIFCGPNQPELCRNNEHHIGNVKGMYQLLGPPHETYGGLEARRNDCQRYCYPVGTTGPVPRSQLPAGARLQSLTSRAPWEFASGQSVQFDVGVFDADGYADVVTVDFAIVSAGQCGLYTRVTKEDEGYQVALNRKSLMSAGEWVNGGVLGEGKPSSSREILENDCVQLQVGNSSIDFIDNNLAIHWVMTFKEGYGTRNNQFLYAEAFDKQGHGSNADSRRILGRSLLIRTTAGISTGITSAAPSTSTSTAIDTAIGRVPIDPQGFVGFVLRWGIGVAGGIAFLLILAGSLKIMVSRGSHEQISDGKEMITNAVVGLVFIILSVAILQILGVDIFNLPGFGK